MYADICDFCFITSNKRQICSMISTSQDGTTSNPNKNTITLKLNFSRQTSLKRPNSESDDQVRQ